MKGRNISESKEQNKKKAEAEAVKRSEKTVFSIDKNKSAFNRVEK